MNKGAENGSTKGLSVGMLETDREFVAVIEETELEDGTEGKCTGVCFCMKIS